MGPKRLRFNYSGLPLKMIVERFPGVSQLPLAEKWQLMVELEEELMADDPTNQDPLKTEILRLLESRQHEFQNNPDSAWTWADLSARMLKSRT